MIGFICGLLLSKHCSALRRVSMQIHSLKLQRFYWSLQRSSVLELRTMKLLIARVSTTTIWEKWHPLRLCPLHLIRKYQPAIFFVHFWKLPMMPNCWSVSISSLFQQWTSFSNIINPIKIIMISQMVFFWFRIFFHILLIWLSEVWSIFYLDIAKTAKLWILIGCLRLRLRLSLPSTNCDPVEKYKFTLHFLQNILTDIECEKRTLVHIEQMFTGRKDNWKILELVKEEEQIRDHILTHMKRKVRKDNFIFHSNNVLLLLSPFFSSLNVWGIFITFTIFFHNFEW